MITHTVETRGKITKLRDLFAFYKKFMKYRKISPTKYYAKKE